MVANSPSSIVNIFQCKLCVNIFDFKKCILNNRRYMSPVTLIGRGSKVTLQKNVLYCFISILEVWGEDQPLIIPQMYFQSKFHERNKNKRSSSRNVFFLSSGVKVTKRMFQHEFLLIKLSYFNDISQIFLLHCSIEGRDGAFLIYYFSVVGGTCTGNNLDLLYSTKHMFNFELQKI